MINDTPYSYNIIDMSNDREVSYWTKRFNIDKDALQYIVNAVGINARSVEDFINEATGAGR